MLTKNLRKNVAILIYLSFICVVLFGSGEVGADDGSESCAKCETCDQIQPVWPDGEQGERGAVGERGEPGETGAKGPQGSPGETGDQGEQGPAGPQGLKGEKGEPGAVGEQGLQGIPARALERDKGEKGVSGAVGQKGVPGFAGCPGAAGKIGIGGEKGEQGDQGPRGPVGKTGQEGDIGPRGKAGPQGQRGRPGRKGVPGEKGEHGDIGPVGDTGEQGDIGTQGAPGPVDTEYSLLRGPKGPKGPKGGHKCVLEPSEILEDFRGELGDRGEEGPRGDFGEPGDDGREGERCDCSSSNATLLKAPHGVAGPSGPQASREQMKGQQGPSPNCQCPKTCLDLPTFPDPVDSVKEPVNKISRSLPGVAGPEGAQGEKGEQGPPGEGRPGEKGDDGPRGKDKCCNKPSVEKSYGHTPTVYVVHSQTIDEEKVDCIDPQAELLWKGFSFLYADINRVATGQDLGRPGSCVPRLDPIPYTDCSPGQPCNTNQRSMQAIWLLAKKNESISTQVPFAELSQHVSRCAVCIAKSPVVTLHRTRSCPANTKELWRGHSLAMFTSSMLSVSADLAHPGSCVQKFQTGLIIECDTSQNCRRYHDLRSHWLHSPGDKTPGEAENCVVCVDKRLNDFNRDLPRPRIYAEHYQSPVAPINPCSSAPGVFPILANGYSLLHLEDTRAVVQDLGSAGSCMPRFSPVPFLTCPTFGNCYAKERQTKASWLSGVPAGPSNGKMTVNLATSPSVLSRCSVCISDAPIVTVHSHNSTVPQCPQRAGKWASLWSGYSFLGHFSNAAGGQQHLDSPGSCLREFMSPVYFECAGATGDCRFQADQHDFWLTAQDSPDADAQQRKARQISIERQTSSKISRCVVCKLIINNSA